MILHDPHCKPTVVEDLGTDRVKALYAIHEPSSKVVWFNWELARALGYNYSRERVITKELEQLIIGELSWRLLEDAHNMSDRRVITVYADRYGGEGLGSNAGSGRSVLFGNKKFIT